MMIRSVCVLPLVFLLVTVRYIFLLDIRNGVSSNWQEALKAHLQQTSLLCLPSMISSLVSYFFAVISGTEGGILEFGVQRCH